MSEEQKKQEAAEAVENKAAAQPEAAVEAKPSQPTASDLLSEDVGEIKVRKAKGSKKRLFRRLPHQRNFQQHESLFHRSRRQCH